MPADDAEQPGADGARTVWEDVGAEQDITEGMLTGVVTASGVPVCLFRHQGVIGAVHDRCTHAEFPLSDGSLMPSGVIECVWHGAQFDCRTGAVRRGPADEPVTRHAVRVEGGRVLVGPAQRETR
jgi:3-phenylpropionate/trans-cinnamate dioxygenase ferredoxin component